MLRLYNMTQDNIKKNLEKWYNESGVEEADRATVILNIVLEMFDENDMEYSMFKKWHMNEVTEVTDILTDLTIKQHENEWSTDSMVYALQYDETFKNIIFQMMSDKYMVTSDIAVDMFIAELYDMSYRHIAVMERNR